jgi:preprotein translocase subunit SecY
VIFASSILAFPATIASMFKGSLAEAFSQQVAIGMPLYNLLFVVGIIFFAYFYTAIIFNPDDVAENMRKYGGFIPGIRPGRPTSEYLSNILSRIILPGSLFLAAIALIPSIFLAVWQITAFPFGGTSILITVGVALETMKQLESQLMMRHYEGFLR